MPSTSAKQAKFMRAVAHSPKFAKKVGVPQSVGKDFEMADKKTKKFDRGGQAYPVRIDLDKAKRDAAARDKAAKDKADEARYRRFMGSDADIVARGNRSQALEANEARTMGVGRAKGGKVMKKADKAGRALVKKSADTMGRAMKMNKGGSCYAGGGLVGGHKSADGIAKRGKTKGKKV